MPKKTKELVARQASFADRRLATKVISRAELRDISILSCSAKNSICGKGAIRTLNISVTAHSKISKKAGKESRIMVRASFSVSGSIVDKPAESVRLEIVFSLAYSLTSDDNLTDENINAFSKWVALNNVWPYAREFVQGMTARMGIAPIKLPLYKPEQMNSLDDCPEVQTDDTKKTTRKKSRNRATHTEQ